MPVPLGQQYTARVSLSAIKDVECIHCRTKYRYEMTREGTGYGSSLLWLDNQGGRQRAAAGAQKQAARQLERECDLVSCPDCGFYQPDMVRRLRKMHGRWLIWIGLLFILVLSWLVPSIVANSAQGNSPYNGWWGTGMLGIGAGFIALKFILGALMDPNAHAIARVGAGEAGDGRAIRA